MTLKEKLTNKQKAARGFNNTDNGQNIHVDKNNEVLKDKKQHKK